MRERRTVAGAHEMWAMDAAAGAASAAASSSTACAARGTLSAAAMPVAARGVQCVYVC